MSLIGKLKKNVLNAWRIKFDNVQFKWMIKLEHFHKIVSVIIIVV